MNNSDDPIAGSQQIVFPIQSLQPEILSQIFTFCLPEYSVDTSVKHATLTLCSVCSLWRAEAIATPSLWAKFHLYLYWRSLEKHSIESIVEHIHTWLGRSGAYPLTIDFTSRGSRNQSIQACTALASYASRWENVTIQVESIPFESWPDLGEVPLLRTLDVKETLHGVPFTSASRLTNLVAWQINIPFPPSPDVTSVPWHQLTAITIGFRMHHNRVLELFQYCARLESFKADVDRPESIASVPFIPLIEHPTLKVLDLNLYGDCGGFLASLMLPALSELRLTNHYNVGPFYSILIDFLNGSHCELDNLTLVDFTFTSDELATLLGQKSCQTLTSLSLEDSFDHFRDTLVGDGVLSRLSFAGVDGEMKAMQLCPHLAKLTLRGYYSKDSSPGLLGKMILSRCSEGRPLSIFNLWTSDEIAEEDKTLMKLARERGLKWNVFVYHGRHDPDVDNDSDTDTDISFQ